jgi:hypothetical protein
VLTAEQALQFGNGAIDGARHQLNGLLHDRIPWKLEPSQG